MLNYQEAEMIVCIRARRSADGTILRPEEENAEYVEIYPNSFKEHVCVHESICDVVIVDGMRIQLNKTGEKDEGSKT